MEIASEEVTSDKLIVYIYGEYIPYNLDDLEEILNENLKQIRRPIYGMKFLTQRVERHIAGLTIGEFVQTYSLPLYKNYYYYDIDTVEKFNHFELNGNVKARLYFEEVDDKISAFVVSSKRIDVLQGFIELMSS